MIELRGVSRSVPSGGGTLTILHPLDLVIPAGRVACFRLRSGFRTRHLHHTIHSHSPFGRLVSPAPDLLLASFFDLSERRAETKERISVFGLGST